MGKHMDYPVGDKLLEPFRQTTLNPFVFNDLKVTIVSAYFTYMTAGWTSPEHAHFFFEFNFVAKGSFNTVMGNNDYKTSEGHATVIAPHVSHNNYKGNDTNYGFCIQFSLSKVETNEEESPFFLYDNLMQGLLEASNKPFEFDGEKHLKGFLEAKGIGIQLAFINFLVALSGCDETSLLSCKTGDMHKSDDSQKDRLLVEQAIFYIKSFTGTQFNVVKMADSLYVSYRHISRIFKKRTGVSILTYYNVQRIERAKKLLESPNMSIKRVVSELGMKNEYYFFHLFKKITNMTPLEYKEKAIGIGFNPKT